MGFARSVGFVIVAALVIVPTITRSRHHIRRESTRLGVRLNPQSDAPPQRTIVTPDASTPAVATATVVRPPQNAHCSPPLRAGEEPVVQSALDNVPDLFRRPPPPRI